MPDHCVRCGVGYAEYLACEDMDCLLASEQEADRVAREKEVARILAMTDAQIVAERDQENERG